MEKILPKLTLVLVFSCVQVSCGKDDNHSLPYDFTELAMESGMHIEATNDNGTVVIDYIGPLKRRFRWDDYDEERTLIPRKERWLGELGAYDPATTYFWNVFTTRIVSNDSQLHFESMEEIDKWLYQGSAVEDWVYTDDGFVVGFSKNSSRSQISIQVFQLYLNGEKPKKLKGSRPENIIISYS